MEDTEEDKRTEKILLNKYLAGTASDDEIKKLKYLSKSSAALKKELNDSDKVLEQIEELELMKQVDTPLAFAKLKDRLEKYREKKGWYYYWQKAAAILLLPMLLFSILQLFVKSPKQLLQTSSQLVYNEIHTPSGLRSVFELPDGSKVWLNGNTKIKYPITFAGNERRIELEGEAYFEVAKNRKKPFILDIGALQVQAVGTAFNCMAYPGENLIETTLTEGSVKITRVLDGVKKGEYMLKQGEVLIYEQENDQFFLKKGDMEKHISWKSGKFVFRNDPLEVVCQKLGRWFNADIEIKDEELKSYSFTGTFSEQGLNEILELISITSPMSYNVGKREVNNNNEYEKLKVTIQSKKRR